MKKTFVLLWATMLLCVTGAWAQSGDFGENNALHWEWADSVLTISGNGAVSWTDYYSPWHEYKDNTRKIVFEEGITQILQDYAFRGWINLTEITFPDTKRGIFVYGGAFDNCMSLKKVVMEAYIDFNGVAIFRNCPIETIYMGRYFDFSGDSPFKDKTMLNELIIGDATTSIRNYAFTGCTGLRELVLPSVSSIGEGAFSECSDLRKVIFLGNLISVYEKAFYNCFTLQSIILKNTVTPPTICYSSTFEGVSGGCGLYVPYGSREAYSNARVWKDFYIVEDVFLQNDVAGQSAVISWYSMSDATGYNLSVYTDEAHTQLFGTYPLNAQGQQNAPAFAPGATSDATRLSYTVGGLSAQTPYYYMLSALIGTDIIATFDSSFFTTDEVGINEVEKSSTTPIQIYPNPARDYFTLSQTGGNSVVVYNHLGMKVFEKGNISDEETIPVANWASGIYHVVIYNNSKMTGSQKLIKK